MKSVIESAAKTASGEPVWRLTKGQFIIDAGKFTLESDASVNERLSLLEERVISIEQADKRYL
ncbi:hypothetical protein [Pseudomonas botevensis]|uniref:hypothetical protein n=1 Tax=Pseudomonas botevensis TaxID=2842352 RepID=UPI001C3CD8CD|nr:hypothetical protein [Pseudomonas botevensis]MBV4477856.1 hypothetical protein [Pseudomonas botevensis]